MKLLILNPSSNIDSIVPKANTQHSKNSFDSILLLQKVPKPSVSFAQSTYFYDASPAQLDETLSSINGVLQLQNGLRVLFLNSENHHVVSRLESPVDIVILEKWPVTLAAKVDIKYGDGMLDKLLQQIKPRYIISKGPYYEHPAFKWSNDTVTRFISLAEEGSGQKWYYAFSINVTGSVEEANLVENPFNVDISKPTDPTIPGAKRSVDTEQSGDTKHEDSDIPRKKLKISPHQCFFCLSNPQAETHMIVTVGSSTYMTIAKGPLTRSNKEMPFSGHGIIIPIEHRPQPNPDIVAEINTYEQQLFHKFKSSYPELVLVSFEFNLHTNVHYHRQFMPINKKFLVENDFESVLSEKCKINNENYPKNHSLEFNLIQQDEISVEEEYLMFKVYEEETPKIYINKVSQDKPLDLQFPRRVLSYIIRSPKRLYWDKCQQPKMKEVNDCEAFKKFFN